MNKQSMTIRAEELRAGDWLFLLKEVVEEVERTGEGRDLYVTVYTGNGSNATMFPGHKLVAIKRNADV